MPFNIDVNYKQNSVVDLGMNNPVTSNPVEPVTAVVKAVMGSFVESSVSKAEVSLSNNQKTMTITGSVVDVNETLNTLFLQADTETHYFKPDAGVPELDSTINHGYTGETAKLSLIENDKYFYMPYIPLTSAYPGYNTLVTGKQFYSLPLSCATLATVNDNEQTFTVLPNSYSLATFIDAGLGGAQDDIYDVQIPTGLCGCDGQEIYESLSGGGVPWNDSLPQTIFDLFLAIINTDNGFLAQFQSPFDDLVVSSGIVGAESYNGIEVAFTLTDLNGIITEIDTQTLAGGVEGNIHTGEGWVRFDPSTVSGTFLRDEEITITLPDTSAYGGYNVKYPDSTNNTLTFWPTPMEINDAVLPIGTVISGDVSGATATIIEAKTAAPIGNYTVNVEIFQYDDDNIFDQGTVNLKGFDPVLNPDGLWNTPPTFTVFPPTDILDWTEPFILGQVDDSDTSTIQVEFAIKRHPNDPGYAPAMPDGPDYIQDLTYGNFQTKRIDSTSTVVSNSGAIRWKFFGSIAQCNEALKGIIYCPITNQNSYLIEMRVYDGFTRNSNTPGAF